MLTKGVNHKRLQRVWTETQRNVGEKNLAISLPGKFKGHVLDGFHVLEII